MTIPAVPSLALSPENRQVLEILAEGAGCTAEEYAEDSLELALFGARIVLNNELGEKYDTGLLIVQAGKVQEGYDLSTIFRGQEEDDVVPMPIDVEDPFVTDEQIPLELDQDIVEDARDICVELQTGLGTFLSTAIDIRHIVDLARQNGQSALLETSIPDEFFDLTSLREE